MRTKDIAEFIVERHAIYERRQAGKPKPWTTNPILQQYRFCNVYRELDSVTVWIRQNWREPYDKDPNLWFAMVVARLVNWPDSLQDISRSVFGKGKVEWLPNQFTRLMDARKKDGHKLFTGAYMIHAGPTEGASKAQYLADEVLTPMWERRMEITSSRGSSVKALASFHAWLMSNKDMGSFMAGQVVADVKFQTAWRKAKDWWDFAAPGPGSQRGLNRVFNNDPNNKWAWGEWSKGLGLLRGEIEPVVAKAGMPRISAQDLQNCLCEFDKHERVRLGEGRPRSLYNGAEPNVKKKPSL